MIISEEAQYCRRQAQHFAGKPEAPFLLHLAEAFDELAARGAQMARHDRRHMQQGSTRVA